MVALAIDYALQHSDHFCLSSLISKNCLSGQGVWIGWPLGGGVIYNTNIHYPVLFTSSFLIGATAAFFKKQRDRQPDVSRNIAYGIDLNDELISLNDTTSSISRLAGLAPNASRLISLRRLRCWCRIFEPMSPIILACAMDSAIRLPRQGLQPPTPPFVLATRTTCEIVSIVGGLSWLGLLFFSVVVFVRPPRIDHSTDGTHSFSMW